MINKLQKRRKTGEKARGNVGERRGCVGRDFLEFKISKQIKFLFLSVAYKI